MFETVTLILFKLIVLFFTSFRIHCYFFCVERCFRIFLTIASWLPHIIIIGPSARVLYLFLEVRLVYVGIDIIRNMNGGDRADKNGTEQNWFHKIHVNSSNFYLTHIVR